MDSLTLFLWLFMFPLPAVVLPSSVHSNLTEDPHNKTDSWSDQRPREMQTAGEQEVKLGKELTITNPEERREMGWNQERLTAERDDEVMGLEEEEKKKLVGGLDYGALGRKRIKNGQIMKEHEEDERRENGERGHLEAIGAKDEEKERVEQRADGGEEGLKVADIDQPSVDTGAVNIKGQYLVVPDKDLTATSSISLYPVEIITDTPSGNPTTDEQKALSSASAMHLPIYDATHSPDTQYGPNLVALVTHVTKTQDPETISHPTRYRQEMAPETVIHSVMDSTRSHLKEDDHLVSQVMEVKVLPTVSVSITRQEVGEIIVSVKKTGYTVKQLKSTAKPKQTKYKVELLQPSANELQPTAKPRDTTKSTKVEAIELQETPTPEMKANLTEEATPPHTRNTTRETYTPPTAKAQLTPISNPTMPDYTTKLKQTMKKLNTKAKKPRKKNKRKGKSLKKDNKSIKLKQKKGSKSAHFPYFKDDYCPAECACYGRVVQCSDKELETVPYGIPYNSRYILLMNNFINSIQLDFFSDFLSMEFLVLSNNRLTDGSVEGAFKSIPALRRLYLDRNLLENVPTNLPASLEELRLDNNWLSGMSEAAWARCPRLLILSLSNNSLGNDTLPTGVLLPLGSMLTLNLDHNQLALVPLGLPLSIRELYLRGNLIQKFPSEVFLGTSELVILDLSANRLTNQGLHTESLLNTTHLESLNLEGNQLDQVPRHLPLSLKTLNLERNLISSVGKSSFLHLPHLEHLGLARNKIVRVASGALRGLLVLHQLDLSHNALRQVPRKLPRGLRAVALTHNNILSVPRDAFCWGGSNPGLSNLLQVQLEHNLIDLGHLDTKAFRCLRGFQVVHLN